MSAILVTGAAGFIGMHVCQALLARGDEVLGVDNMNDYYDPTLKLARLDQLRDRAGFTFEKIDIADTAAVQQLFQRHAFRKVVNLAAQAGVRHSLTHPHAYVQANLVGFLNVLEGCRARRIEHLVYASSSSVYGGNTKLPFSEDDPVDRPVSLYAATKKANELMAHSYAHLYGIPCSGLRFFTVYGPWGRPDMACWKFTRAMLAGEPVQVFNHGRMPMQPGDLPATYADASHINELFGAPRRFTPVTVGLRRFVDWYRDYHAIPGRATDHSAKEEAHES
jgi:UDP-glucuronate 4-epimerase